MLVKELIKELAEFNLEADVSLIDAEDICISYISTDGATKETTKQVFIEGADLCQTCYYYDDDYCLAYEDNPDKVTECYMYEREECL